MSVKSDAESLQASIMDVHNDRNHTLPSIRKQNEKTNDSTILNIERESLMDIFQKASRLEIYTWLEGKNLGEIIDKHTVLYHIMQNTIDGDKIVLQQLDEYIKTTSSQDHKHERTMKIEFSRLESGDYKGCELIKDILRIPQDASKDVLLHPVIEAYLDIKWKKTRKYISAHFCIYLAFLLTYSWFLANIFYRPLHHPNEFSNIVISSSDLIQFPSTLPPLYPTSVDESPSNGTKENIIFSRKHENPSLRYPQNIVLRLRPELFSHKARTTKESFGANNGNHSHETFSRCSGDSSDDMRTCAREIVMFTTIILLFVGEVLQFLSLGPYTSISELRFYFNFDNFIQIIVILLAAACLVVQNEDHWVKWISAFGIVFAYIEFVFLLGRCPPIPCLHSGQSSVMFYNITRRIFKILLNLFILVVGFAFGFFILQKDTAHDHFENPMKSIVKTLIMVLGEYESNDMLEGEYENDNKLTLYFTMILLALLAIIGSLVMINLVVAIIVSDIEELKMDGILQDTMNKAYHIISHGNFCQWSINGKVGSSMKKEFADSKVEEICIHSICFKCKGLKFSSHIKRRLIEILDKRTFLPFKYGASSV